MNGLMMTYSLSVPAILKRAETLYASKEIVSERRVDALLKSTRFPSKTTASQTS